MTELVRAARRAQQAKERVAQAVDERDALIVELHRQGESPKLLAEAVGLSENQIFKIVRQAKGRSDG
jgi:transposase